MELKDNPLLQQEDYLAGYREKVEALKNNPNLVQFDKLCFELFNSDIGKRWMEYVVDHYLIPPLADRNSPEFPTASVWAEGFKDFGRMLRSYVKSHEQRIKAESNK